MVTIVEVGSMYQDEGAMVEDLVVTATGGTVTVNLTNGILTRVLSPSGELVDAVSTDAPTGDGTNGGLPYIVVYDAVDDAGNRAETVYRRVYVTCAPPEYECPPRELDDGSVTRTCSRAGICGVDQLPDLTTSGGRSSASEDESAPEEQIPWLALNGEQTVTIKAGTVYLPCGAVASDCDPGSTATLGTFGDLDHKASPACPANTVQSGHVSRYTARTSGGVSDCSIEGP
jgi:hypothetical protein